MRYYHLHMYEYRMIPLCDHRVQANHYTSVNSYTKTKMGWEDFDIQLCPECEKELGLLLLNKENA